MQRSAVSFLSVSEWTVATDFVREVFVGRVGHGSGRLHPWVGRVIKFSVLDSSGWDGFSVKNSD